VVSAVRRWQDPWRKHREMSAEPPATYSTTPAHPLHPLCSVADPGGIGGGGTGRGALGRGLQSFPFQLNLSTSVHRITQSNS
jgi:hypothetical protein